MLLLLHYTNRIPSFFDGSMCATYRICLENTLHFCFYFFIFFFPPFFFCYVCLSYCYVLVLQQITFTFSLLQFLLFLCLVVPHPHQNCKDLYLDSVIRHLGGNWWQSLERNASSNVENDCFIIITTTGTTAAIIHFPSEFSS